MSQRNPMNDRYQTDEKKGQTRKSAAAAKPKTKAASSVRIESPTKTPQQKKAAAKAQRQQQSTLDRKYYNPPTAEYKKWRKIWWGLLIGAIVMTAASFLVRMWIPENEFVSLAVLGVGYVGIIGALVVDFTKIRKIRRTYQAEMQAKISKEERAREKQEHAAALAAKKAAAEAAEKAKEEGTEAEAPKKKGLFAFANLRGSAQRASQANKAAAREAGEAAKDGAEGVAKEKTK